MYCKCNVNLGDIPSCMPHPTPILLHTLSLFDIDENWVLFESFKCLLVIKYPVQSFQSSCEKRM